MTVQSSDHADAGTEMAPTLASPQRVWYETGWLIAEASGRDHIIDALDSIRIEYAVSGLHVIELGSGIGTNLQVFAQHNRVLGIEGMNTAVEESRRRGIEAIAADLARKIPLPDECADWVLCIDVLEHLVDPARCLTDARRVLRDRGHIVVNVPNHFDWRGRLRILFGSGIDSQHYFGNSRHWEYPHLRFFSRASIEDLLVTSGFEIVRDYTSKFVSFPKAQFWRRVGMGPVLRWLQSSLPDLFSGGFFLLCRKR